MSDELNEKPEFERFLKEAASRASTDDPAEITVRQMLAMIGQARRGPRVVRRLEQYLNEAGLRTDPPFTQTWVDNKIAFLPATVTSAGGDLEGADEAAPIGIKVASLASANCEIVSVCPQDSIELALSLMQLHDYSQLAVMSGSHSLKGAVTWQSIATSRFKTPEITLTDAMVLHPPEVRYDEDLIPVIPRIAGPGFAFVRGTDNSISGIVTAADLGERFAQLAEPFLALEELERRLRIIIIRHFSVEEIRATADPSDQRDIESADDLTLGDVVHLLQKPQNFDRLSWPVDRNVFVTALDDVRNIRNELVHFSPDPLEDSRSRCYTAS